MNYPGQRMLVLIDRCSCSRGVSSGIDEIAVFEG